jgi:glycosyltransferase involved in cell wall biosynthesis
MLVTYNAPNRAHHYTYAAALARAGHLRRFVCAFSRFSPRAGLPGLGDKLLRADHLQNFYLASLRLRLPSALSEELTYWSKIWLDACSTRDALQSDVFLFYGGAGLRTLRALKPTRVAGVVEVVNSHVLTQKQILEEEHARLKLPVQGFHDREVARRVEEYHQADGIICPSTFSWQSFIDQGFDPARLRIVPYGVASVANHDPVERPAKEVFRVLYVGQLNLRKGVRYLLEAFRKLKHPGKELWLVGPATEQTGYEDLAIPEGTRFLGVLKGEALDRAYRSCDVFVLPAIEEGFGLVIGEALSHGLPVIATVNSGAPDVYRDGSIGFLVPIRSSEAIYEKLQLLADDRALREEMSHRATAPNHGLQDWETTGRQLVQALKDFARQPKV